MQQNSINLEQDYREKIIHIWEKFESLNVLSQDEKKYRKSPQLPDKVETNCLLFIGLNPSFGKDSNIPENERLINFYPQIENSSRKEIQYFEKFKEIAKYCNVEWSHLDLFFMRETNQKVIEELCFEKTNIQFLNEQLEISFEIIKRAKPKLIVVTNSFASEFFGKMKAKHAKFPRIWQAHKFFFEDDKERNETKTFDTTIGSYQIHLENQSIPIIFTGMLSGQRALDIGSLERLKWQIKMILERKSMNS